MVCICDPSTQDRRVRQKNHLEGHRPASLEYKPWQTQERPYNNKEEGRELVPKLCPLTHTHLPPCTPTYCPHLCTISMYTTFLKKDVLVVEHREEVQAAISFEQELHQATPLDVSQVALGAEQVRQ